MGLTYGKEGARQDSVWGSIIQTSRSSLVTGDTEAEGNIQSQPGIPS